MTSKMTMVGKTGISRTGAALAICAALALTGLRQRLRPERDGPGDAPPARGSGRACPARTATRSGTLFRDNDNPNVTVEVNRYLWNASLEILDFMPIEAADPFSGVLSFG